MHDAIFTKHKKDTDTWKKKKKTLDEWLADKEAYDRAVVGRVCAFRPLMCGI
jgi:hypothetical protein